MISRKRENRRSGYTLLFAVLTAALVLGVAAFVAGIARKQYIISATARDSMYAFYNADAGLECLLSSESWEGGGRATTSASMECGGVTYSGSNFNFLPSSRSGFTGQVYGLNGDSGIYIKTTNNSGTDGCARLKVWSGYDLNGIPKIIVESSGYNICSFIGIPPDESPNGPAASTRTVERTIKLTQ